MRQFGGTAMEIIRRERHGDPFYACGDPEWAGAAHGFSTRLGGVSPAPLDSLNLGAGRGDNPANLRENFFRFCSAVGAARSSEHTSQLQSH